MVPGARIPSGRPHVPALSRRRQGFESPAGRHAISRASPDQVADRFLNHRDRKFRLSYIVGSRRKDANRERAAEDDDEFSFGKDEPDPIKATDEDGGLTATERAMNREVPEGFLSQVSLLTANAANRLSTDLGIEPGKPSGADREAAE
jgi:hypothetical protein